MSQPRFFCPDIRDAPSARIDVAEARHALGSRRLADGDTVELFDGRGARAQARIELPADPRGRRPRSAARDGISVRIERVELTPLPIRTLTLIVAGCKGSRLDWLVEKCTELDVTRVVFARFERSVVYPGAGHVDKLRRTAIEACKQCGRDWLPEFAADLALREAVRASRVAGAPSSTQPPAGPWPPALLVAHPTPAACAVSLALAAAGAAQRRHFAAVIGPEGGLSDAELADLLSLGGVLVRLGPHVLRVETAAVALAGAWSGSA